MKKNEKHCLSKHPLYSVWTDMKKRCCNEKAKSYPTYGGRGVVVCELWINSFKSFYNWCMGNGWKPGLEIDKDIKGNGLLYSPETCIVVTRKQNTNCRVSSQKIEHDGNIKTLSEWQDITGIEQGVLWDRIFRYKWNVEKALTTPVIIDRKKKILCVNTGEIFSSATEASKNKNLLRTSIVSVLSGRRLSTGGLSFQYYNF